MVGDSIVKDRDGAFLQGYANGFLRRAHDAGNPALVRENSALAGGIVMAGRGFAAHNSSAELMKAREGRHDAGVSRAQQVGQSGKGSASS